MSTDVRKPPNQTGFTVHLSDPAWTSDGGTYVRGTAYVDGGRRDGTALARVFEGVTSTDEFRDTVESLEGFFAVVHETEGAMYAAVDHVQTSSVLYGRDDETVYVSDDGSWIRSQLGERERDSLAETEFLLTGYVTGGETLYPDIRQLQSGELLHADIENGSDPIETERYYRYQPDGAATATKEELLDRIDDALVQAFERTIEIANGRTIVVPLSGGYDSRLVVLMLDALGYDDLIAISWGTSWESEHEVSKRIAEEIGIQWEYVEYSNERWHDWFHSEERESYYDKFFDYDALPGLANLAWPAIMELSESDRIPDDALFVPGHTAVSPSEHFPEATLTADTWGEDRVKEFLKNVHYKLWDYDEAFDDVLDERILRAVETTDLDDPENAVRAVVEWYWQERQAKFINGDLDTYAFAGHDWWMPLLDPAFVSVWEAVPMEDRFDKSLYRTYVEDRYRELTGVSIDEAQETEMTSPSRRLHTWLFHSPAFHLVRPFYVRARYYFDPRGWPGIMPCSQFTELFTGRERAFSFFGLHILDRVSFDPPENRNVPVDGKLDVPKDALR